MGKMFETKWQSLSSKILNYTFDAIHSIQQHVQTICKKYARSRKNLSPEGIYRKNPDTSWFFLQIPSRFTQIKLFYRTQMASLVMLVKRLSRRGNKGRRRKRTHGNEATRRRFLGLQLLTLPNTLRIPQQCCG